MVIAEMQILKKLGFNVHVQLPYAIMVNYLKVLELTEHPTIPQRAWGFLNDGYVLVFSKSLLLRSTLCMNMFSLRHIDHALSTTG